MKRTALAARVAIEVLRLVAAIRMILTLPGFVADPSRAAPQAHTREAGR
jgi:hypothetical protein